MDNLYHHNQIATELATQMGLEPVLSKLLVQKGITTQQAANKFLSPSLSDVASPFCLFGMQEAVALAEKHIQNHSRILIFGDYDCDGVGACAILYLTLQHLGATPSVFIPTREEDGYGLSIHALESALLETPADLVITVDCGITSQNEVRYLQEKGIDVLVTDHHEVLETAPPCVVLNPKWHEMQTGTQPDCGDLCGAGVAFLLATALADMGHTRQYLDILAISTIADMVPLVGDNRVYARLGLEALQKRGRLGIRKLLDVAKVKDTTVLTSSDVSFKIAPRLNAAGRLSSAMRAFELLICTNKKEAESIAEELEHENISRKELCKTTQDSALKKVEAVDIYRERILVLSDDNWDGGVVGIVASTLSDLFCLPTILFSKKEGGVLKGSCRSIPGVNIHKVLTHCTNHLLQFGGHEMAAGLTILEENLAAFSAAANEYLQENIESAVFVPKGKSAIPLDFLDINRKLARELRQFEPFGIGNVQPYFSTQHHARNFKHIGKNGGDHYKMSISDSEGVDLLAFQATELLPLFSQGVAVESIYEISLNEYKQHENVNCIIKSMVPTLTELPSAEVLRLNYFESHFVSDKAREGVEKHSFLPSETRGQLLVCFCKDTYQMLCAAHPTYLKCYRILPNTCPMNAVLLSPAPKQKNMLHFASIAVYDKPSDAFVLALSASTRGQVVVKDSTPNFDGAKRISIETLRTLFQQLAAVCKKNPDQTHVLKILLQNNPSLSKTELLTVGCFFGSVGLLNR